MKISSKLLILTLGFGFVGCNSLKRLPGLESPHSTPSDNAINPNDFYITGTTTKDHESVYLTVSSRTITVEVMRQGETVWSVLQRPDAYDSFDSYQLFTIPRQGVHFGDLAYRDDSGIHLLTGVPAVPTGTQYKIHSIKGV